MLSPALVKSEDIWKNRKKIRLCYIPSKQFSQSIFSVQGISWVLRLIFSTSLNLPSKDVSHQAYIKFSHPQNSLGGNSTKLLGVEWRTEAFVLNLKLKLRYEVHVLDTSSIGKDNEWTVPICLLQVTDDFTDFSHTSPFHFLPRLGPTIIILHTEACTYVWWFLLPFSEFPFKFQYMLFQMREPALYIGFREWVRH